MPLKDKDLHEAKTPDQQAENLSPQDRLKTLTEENQYLTKQVREHELLFNANPAGLILIQTGTLLSFNQPVLDKLGYTAQELQGQTWEDLIDPEGMPHFKKRTPKHQQDHAVPARFETSLRRKDGSKWQGEIIVSRLKFRGQPAFLAALIEPDAGFQDREESTRVKKMETLLDMAAYLQRRLEPVLTTPPRPKMPDNSASLMEKWRQTEKIFNQIKSDLRTLDNLAKGPYEPDRLTWFRLKSAMAPVIEQVQARLQEIAAPSTGPIVLKTYLRTDPLIQGNLRDFQTALAALLQNAVEAISGNGEIHVSAEQTSGQIHIYIQDNGSGIPEKLLPRVFDPFFSAKNRGNPGLGLSHARAVIQRHQGALECAGQPGRGTTVTIKLPLMTEAPLEKGALPPAKIRGARILIIDSQDLIRPLLSELLKNKGFKVLMCSAGFEALAHLKNKTHDLVIIGTTIGDMPKPVLRQEIKKLDGRLPVVTILEQKDRERQAKAGAGESDLVLFLPLDLAKTVPQIVGLLREGRKG